MPRLLHAEVPAVTDYYVVENLDSHYLARFHELLRDIHIFLARRGVCDRIL